MHESKTITIHKFVRFNICWGTRTLYKNIVRNYSERQLEILINKWDYGTIIIVL